MTTTFTDMHQAYVRMHKKEMQERLKKALKGVLWGSTRPLRAANTGNASDHTRLGRAIRGFNR